MSKKHYEAFAKLAVHQAHRFNDEADRTIFVYNMALIFEADNENFNMKKFLTACGVMSDS